MHEWLNQSISYDILTFHQICLNCFEISGEKYFHIVRVVILGTDKGKQMHFSDLFLSRDENLKSINYSVLCHSLPAELSISHLQICIIFFMQKSYRSKKS